VNKVENIKIGKEYLVSTTGSSTFLVEVKIVIIKCKERAIWNPLTWFNICVEESREINTIIEKPDLLFYQKNGKLATYRHTEGTFESSYIYPKNLAGKKIEVIRQIFSTIIFKERKVTLFEKSSTAIKVPIISETILGEKDGMRFPFQNSEGVTQWHGYTKYQSPHTGIDFGVTKKAIYAIEKGTVEFAGWDSYYGKCLSGGNILRIKHPNGKHSVYMHLNDFNGLKVGENVLKGDIIGTSGNSGAYNCQSLAYHLHFEIREERSQSTHIDPVPNINIDWNLIPTLQYQTYPGRLSGDNPHPSR
jgi:murein DD-endopeptidase MepM/ murein hydrolase activator NlpD